MAKNNRTDKPTIDAMSQRRSGERGWQLNLREQLPVQPPKHILDLREPEGVKNQRFFEYMQLDAFPPRPEYAEDPWDDELDVDEKLAGWWQWARETAREWPAASWAALTALWDRVRPTDLWPRRRALGVILAIALLSSLGVMVAAGNSVQRISQLGTGTPGRGGIPATGALPTTGAGNWLAILQNYLARNYQKLNPESKAVPSPLPASRASGTSASGLPSVTQPTAPGVAPATQPTGSTGSDGGSAPSTPSAPVTEPVQPLIDPLQPLQTVTQPLQTITQPLNPSL